MYRGEERLWRGWVGGKKESWAEGKGEGRRRLDALGGHFPPSMPKNQIPVRPFISCTEEKWAERIRGVLLGRTAGTSTRGTDGESRVHLLTFAGPRALRIHVCRHRSGNHLSRGQRPSAER